jgi:hypothetical protein
VICYVAYYMQNLNRRDAAFLYVRVMFPHVLVLTTNEWY